MARDNHHGVALVVDCGKLRVLGRYARRGVCEEFEGALPCMLGMRQVVGWMEVSYREPSYGENHHRPRAWAAEAQQPVRGCRRWRERSVRQLMVSHQITQSGSWGSPWFGQV